MKKYRSLHIPTGEFEEACIEENKIHDLFYVITRACIKYKKCYGTNCNDCMWYRYDALKNKNLYEIIELEE
jgi:hypothetical protein